MKKIPINGWLKLRREYNKKLIDGQISLEEFGLLMFYAMNTDWDRRHSKFGKVSFSDNKISKLIKNSNRAKIKKLRESLIRHKEIKIEKTEGNNLIITVLNFEDMQPKIDYKMRDIFAAIQEDDKQY